MADIPWLARYCATPLEASYRREWSASVHSIDGWSVATDGRGIVAYSDGGVQEWPPATVPDANRRKAEQALRPFLTSQRVGSHPAPWHALALWCGHVSWEWCVCTQQDPGDRPAGWTLRDGCPDCEGSLRELPGGPIRPGWVGGVLVDRNRLGWLLAPELAHDRDTFVAGRWGMPDNAAMKRDAGAVLILDGARCRLCLMGWGVPNKPPGEHLPQPPYPTFYPDPTFLALWLEERGDPVARLLLADWLEDRGDPYAAALRTEEAAST